jgi:putative FmdB family regulatory protein
MPIYEYQCEKCHHHLEALQKFSDKPLRECPECGKHALKRMISAPMFRLAGSGWYETDFKSDNERKRNLAGKDEAPAETAKDSGGDKQPDAKPEKAAKPEPKKTIITKPAVKSRPAAAKQKSKPAAKKAGGKAARKR